MIVAMREIERRSEMRNRREFNGSEFIVERREGV